MEVLPTSTFELRNLFKDIPWSCLYLYRTLTPLSQTLIQHMLFPVLSNARPDIRESYVPFTLSLSDCYAEEWTREVDAAYKTLLEHGILQLNPAANKPDRRDAYLAHYFFFSQLYAMTFTEPDPISFTKNNLFKYYITGGIKTDPTESERVYLGHYSYKNTEGPFASLLDRLLNATVTPGGSPSSKDFWTQFFMYMGFIPINQKQQPLTKLGFEFLLGRECDQASIFLRSLHGIFAGNTHGVGNRAAFFRLTQIAMDSERQVLQQKITGRSKSELDQNALKIVSRALDCEAVSYEKVQGISDEYAQHVMGLFINFMLLNPCDCCDVSKELISYFLPVLFWLHISGFVILSSRVSNNDIYYRICLPNIWKHLVIGSSSEQQSLKEILYDRTDFCRTSHYTLDFEGDGAQASQHDEETTENYIVTESTGRIYAYRTQNEQMNRRHANLLKMICGPPKHEFPHVDVYEIKHVNESVSAALIGKFLNSRAHPSVQAENGMNVPPTLINQLEYEERKQKDAEEISRPCCVQAYQFYFKADDSQMKRCSSVMYYIAYNVALNLNCLVWCDLPLIERIGHICRRLLRMPFYESGESLDKLTEEEQHTVRRLWNEIANFYRQMEYGCGGQRQVPAFLVIQEQQRGPFEQELDRRMQRISPSWGSLSGI